MASSGSLNFDDARELEENPLQSISRSEEWVAIVDDDESIRRSLNRLFLTNGINTRYCSAEDYLSRATNGQPRCMVLDVQAGGLNGFQSQDRLRDEGRAPPSSSSPRSMRYRPPSWRVAPVPAVFFASRSTRGPFSISFECTSARQGSPMLGGAASWRDAVPDDMFWPEFPPEKCYA